MDYHCRIYGHKFPAVKRNIVTVLAAREFSMQLKGFNDYEDYNRDHQERRYLIGNPIKRADRVF